MGEEESVAEGRHKVSGTGGEAGFDGDGIEGVRGMGAMANDVEGDDIIAGEVGEGEEMGVVGLDGVVAIQAEEPVGHGSFGDHTLHSRFFVVEKKLRGKGGIGQGVGRWRQALSEGEVGGEEVRAADESEGEGMDGSVDFVERGGEGVEIGKGKGVENAGDPAGGGNDGEGGAAHADARGTHGLGEELVGAGHPGGRADGGKEARGEEALLDGVADEALVTRDLGREEGAGVDAAVVMDADVDRLDGNHKGSLVLAIIREGQDLVEEGLGVVVEGNEGLLGEGAGADVGAQAAVAFASDGDEVREDSGAGEGGVGGEEEAAFFDDTVVLLPFGRVQTGEVAVLGVSLMPGLGAGLGRDVGEEVVDYGVEGELWEEGADGIEDVRSDAAEASGAEDPALLGALVADTNLDMEQASDGVDMGEDHRTVGAVDTVEDASGGGHATVPGVQHGLPARAGEAVLLVELALGTAGLVVRAETEGGTLAPRGDADATLDGAHGLEHLLAGGGVEDGSVRGFDGLAGSKDGPAVGVEALGVSQGLLGTVDLVEESGGGEVEELHGFGGEEASELKALEAGILPDEGGGEGSVRDVADVAEEGVEEAEDVGGAVGARDTFLNLFEQLVGRDVDLRATVGRGSGRSGAWGEEGDANGNTFTCSGERAVRLEEGGAFGPPAVFEVVGSLFDEGGDGVEGSGRDRGVGWMVEWGCGGGSGGVEGDVAGGGRWVGGRG